MDPSTWQQIETILDQVLHLDKSDCTRYIEKHIDDPDLKQEINALLEAELNAPRFLDQGLDRYFTQQEDIHEIAEDFLQQDFKIDRYQIEKEIGRGGMSVVYLAERTDGEFNQKVAVKIIQPFGTDREDRFRRLRAERQILANLQHPNIGRVFDGGVTPEGWPYMVMELVHGIPITTYCREKKLDLNTRLELFQNVCDAVIYAHRNLVVHRDLKPGNILVTESGEVKLLDFGIAKLLEEDKDAAPLTQTGLPLMTPEYAAPEQFRGETVTTSVDVYSLGVILYELLTGGRPYDLSYKSITEMERLICEENPINPSERIARPDRFPSEEIEISVTAQKTVKSKPVRSQLSLQLRGDLDIICLKALRKEPTERYGSVRDLQEDINRYLTGLPISARPATAGYRIRKFVQRHRAGVAVASLGILMVTGFISALIYQQSVTRQQRDRAQLETQKATEVTEFMLSLFEAGDPNEALGDTLTVSRLLDLGVERARALDVQPAVQAEMFGVIGQAYRNLSLFENADSLLIQALHINRKTYGENHPEVAKSKRNLADLYRMRGNFDEADLLYRDALAAQVDLFDSRHPEMAQTLNSLAVTLRHKGEYETADSLFSEALKLRKTIFGDSHPLVAESLSGLAAVRHFLGDYDSAETYYREALDIQRNTLPEYHWRRGTTLNNLGALLNEKGDYNAAETLYSEVLQIRRRLYGEMHPSVALTLNNLAVTKSFQGDMKGAEEAYQNALIIQRELLDEKHPRIALTLNNLGMLFYSMGEYITAESYHREALAMRRIMLGDEHPDVAQSFNNLAQTLFEIGELTEAVQLQKSAVSIYQKVFSKPHSRLARSIHNLAKIRVMQNSYLEAEQLFKEALEQRIDLLGDKHPDTQITLRHLNELYGIWNKPEKAAELQTLLADEL